MLAFQLIPGLPPVELDLELPERPDLDSFLSVLPPLLALAPSRRLNFEHVRVRYPRGASTPGSLFVDDEGLLRNLPYNAEASKYYPAGIYGRAVLFPRNVWF